MVELVSWENWLLNREKAIKTVNAYLSDIKLYFEWIIGEKGIKDVDIEVIKSLTPEDNESFLTYLRVEKKCKASTRARYISAIKSFYGYLCEFNNIKNISLKLETPKLPQRQPKYLTQKEAQNLLLSVGNCHNVRNTAILMIFLNVGLRMEELININLDDLQEIEVENENGEIEHLISIQIIGKGNKERPVVVNQDTRNAIMEWLEIRPNVDTPALFVSERKCRISHNGIHTLVKNALKNIGREDLSTHKLRHSAATMMLENGEPLPAIQEVLGHSSLKSTGIYTHVSKKRLIKASQGIKLVKKEDE